jgi:hypothetical protein
MVAKSKPSDYCSFPKVGFVSQESSIPTRPRRWRRRTDAIPPYKGTNIGEGVLPAYIGVRMPTPNRGRLAVAGQQRTRTYVRWPTRHTLTPSGSYVSPSPAAPARRLCKCRLHNWPSSRRHGPTHRQAAAWPATVPASLLRLLIRSLEGSTLTRDLLSIHRPIRGFLESRFIVPAFCVISWLPVVWRFALVPATAL